MWSLKRSYDVNYWPHIYQRKLRKEKKTGSLRMWPLACTPRRLAFDTIDCITCDNLLMCYLMRSFMERKKMISRAMFQGQLLASYPPKEIKQKIRRGQPLILPQIVRYNLARSQGIYHICNRSCNVKCNLSCSLSRSTHIFSTCPKEILKKNEKKKASLRMWLLVP